MSHSSESLSPAVSSLGLPAFIEAKISLDAILASYQALDASDDTKRFLEICFKYFPSEGQTNLLEDVCNCRNDEELRQLAASIDVGLLRPLLSKGGKSPSITSSSCINFDPPDVTTASQNEKRLLSNCLKRDGYRCTITKGWSSSHKFPPNEPRAPLQAVHILPLALCSSFTNEDERRHSSLVWGNIFRYFPSIRSTINMSPENVNREDNMMMMINPLHVEFGAFHFILEPTSTPDRYHLKTFPSFASVYSIHLPHDRVVILKSHDPDFPLPAVKHLQLHAAIGNILHASGRAKIFEKLTRDLDASVISKDGSTDLGNLLSVSVLSLLASDSRSLERSFLTDSEESLGGDISRPAYQE